MVYDIDASDVMLTAMPMYHIAGMLFGLTTPLYAGSTATIMIRFDTEAMAASIQTFKCSKMYGTVSMNVAMMHLPNLASYDLTSMRTTLATSFGVALNEQIVENWNKVTQGGLMVEAAYGLSETHTFDTFSPLDKPRIGSVGIPNLGTDIIIVDFDDINVELPPGQIGEIVVKSPAVFKGYWGREDETRESLRNGRLYTGDMGKLDEDGYFVFCGQKMEMIKPRGSPSLPKRWRSFSCATLPCTKRRASPFPMLPGASQSRHSLSSKPDYVSKIFRRRTHRIGLKEKWQHTNVRGS